MKIRYIQILVLAAFIFVRGVAVADYASDIATVSEAQAQALEQAKQMLGQVKKPEVRDALKKAIQDMEHAGLMLGDAKNSPEKLNAAITTEEAAYQLLLKTISHEFQVSRSKGKGRGGRAGQPRPGQLDQLELATNENRYENERQATAAQTPQQKEQLQIADRLKQLAQRQQDLNDRLKELQTALEEARTDQEREDIKRQLKRLSDEERQALADVDELKQSMDQSPNSSSLANARQQLDQVRNDTQRASEELQMESVSQALAAGSRAQEKMQDLRENMKNQASSQFARQMRDMRSEARELANQEENIGATLDSLANSEHKSLDDSAQRQRLVQQMQQQESSLTNLLGGMQSVSEQAESSEPLLSEQLYDTLRRASQMHNDNLLQTGEQLVDHGLVSQAGQAESSVRTNFNELRQKVERAAQSVLGNESEALQYAQKELDDLSAKIESEVAKAGTNNSSSRSGMGRIRGGTNSVASAGSGNGEGQSTNQNSGQVAYGHGAKPGQSGDGQNTTDGNESGARQRQSSDNRPRQRGSGSGQTPGENPVAQNSPSDGQSNGGDQQGSNPGQSPSTNGEKPGESQDSQKSTAANQPGNSGQQGSKPGKGQQGSGAGQGQGGSADGQNSPSDNQPNGENTQASGANPGTGGNQDGSQNGQGGGDRERLRDIARQFGGTASAGVSASGGARGGLGMNGPITGNQFVDWTDRMRDVEQVVDSAELRNRLAAVRERVAAYRSEFRKRGQKPDAETLRSTVLDPMTEVRTRLQEDLARLANANSLIPLDHDPVPENYTEMVRKYYEKLGGGQ